MSSPLSRGRRHGERGQMIVVLALALVAVTSMAGLLLDGANAWAAERQGQAAADTSTLAAAELLSRGASITTARVTARDIADDNGFNTNLVDCGGTTQAGLGVEVNRPPLSGPNMGNSGFVEVIVRRAQHNTVSAAIGQGCWIITKRAVSSILSSAVATCNFCVLGNEGTPETLGLDSNANLRVDGAIVVNKANWTAGTAAVNRCGVNPCSAPTCLPTPWSRPGGNSSIETMCGQSFNLTNTNGGTDLLSARTISVGGGWQARIQDLVRADELAPGCVYHPTPADWLPTVANVCIGMSPIVDPLNDSANPGNIIDPPDPNTLTVPVAGVNGCPAGARVPTGTLGSPARLHLSGTTAGGPYFTICPGIYYGGFSMNGDSRNVKATMMPGVYFMVGGGASGGGGFVVTGTASIDGSSGVMIYLTGGDEAFTSSSLPGTGLVPACDPLTSACVAPLTSGSGNGISSSDLTTTVNTNVTYTLQLQGNPLTLLPTGLVTFYDGTTAISAACTDVPLALVSGSTNKVKATCTTQYPLFGTRGITAVYFGDANYKAVGPSLIETINAPVGLQAGTFNINTTVSPCSLPVQCGQVLLHAPTSGDYAGMLVFQDRLSGLGMTVWPDAGAPACTGSWMTDGVPPDTNPAPQPCGPLGGLSGTIYAPHLSTGASGDHDAGINFRTSGAANLQIITGTVSLYYPGNTRFTYRPELFANGLIHLVE